MSFRGTATSQPGTTGRLAAAGFTAGYFYRAVVNGCRSVHRRRRAFPAAEAAPRPEPGTSAEDVVLLSEAEIAEAMRISRGTVKSTTARGLAALGRNLRQEGL
jgi:hypothetical protein